LITKHSINSGFSLNSKTSDASGLERWSATVLRSLVLLLAAYIVFHKIFPLDLLDKRLVDMTLGELLLVVLEVLSASTAAGYLIIKGFKYPSAANRDRVWCERWSGIAFGMATIIMGSALVTLLGRKGINFGAARWIAHGVLWLLF
jgi:hypothetical protein